jgi:energy-coupling factor transport system ATP-binding protein
MVGNPKLLLLDEPTAQLDPLAAEQFWQTAERIREELGTAAIICEHRTEHFFGICDKLLYLENGAQKFVLPPELAAKSLKNSSMFYGLPCATQLSAALEIADLQLSSASEGMKFVKSRYGKSAPEEHFCDTADVKSDKKSAAVWVENLGFRYERYGKNVVDGLDFSANFGKITALCGANGTGKSTILKLISGAISPQEGKIFVCGKRISAYKSSSLYRNLLVMLPQNPLDILIEETVSDEILRSAEGEKYSPEEISRVTEELQIGENLLGTHPFDLSGGEAQRVALAKLLLTKPQILLLDEPTKGLDPVCKSRLSEVLKRLAERGAAVIFVTHDLDFAAETADEIALIFGGRAVACEQSTEFLRKNSVYTTAAARIGRAFFPDSVTTQKLICACAAAEKSEKESEHR